MSSTSLDKSATANGNTVCLETGQASSSHQSFVDGHRFCVAPMMDWTDRYQRYFMRLISRHAWLYTEMVTTGALIHGDQARHLDFDPSEHPIALQLGGSKPKDLAMCSTLAEQWGYDEINLNVGCPSDRVQNGQFGACLMKSPQLVSDCVKAMRDACGLPITVKCRIGVDDQDSYEAFRDFIGTVAEGGCDLFIVHARKAWLQGLSPKQNREIPELNYEFVHRVKGEFNQLSFVLNGGLTDLDECIKELQQLDGVMLGREAYQNPFLLAPVDALIYQDASQSRSRAEVIEDLLPFIELQLSKGIALKKLTRHILGLFHGQTGAKAWRRHLSQNAYLPEASTKTVLDALALTENTKRFQRQA